MNFLFLRSDDSDSFMSFLDGVSRSLRKKGHSVYLAIESPSVLVDRPPLALGDYEDVFYFSEFESAQLDLSGVPLNFSVGYSCDIDRSTRRNCPKRLDRMTKDRGLPQRMFEFFSTIIESKSIDAILYEAVSGLFSHMAYVASVQQGIAYLGFMPARIPGRYELWSDPYGDVEARRALFEKRVQTPSSEMTPERRAYVDGISSIAPSYMENNASSNKRRITSVFLKKTDYLTRNWHIWQKYRANEESYMLSFPMSAAVHSFFYHLRRHKNMKWLKRQVKALPKDTPYYVFPLHLQPEASTSVISPYVNNQATVIKNIALSLPNGTVLAVKDHPNGMGFLTKREYEEILALPNVFYIDPDEDKDSLIRNSLGVVTISSTMGYEALLMQKPVITFGNVFYNYHPYCIHLNSFDALFDTLRTLPVTHHEDFDEANEAFVDVYFNTSYPGTLFSEDADQIESFANALVDRVAGLQ